MQAIKFYIDASLPATPFVSQTLRGGKTFSIAFPEGKVTAIFIQQSVDGSSWQQKQSVSPTNKGVFHVTANNDTYLRVLVSTRPIKAEYEDYDTPGGTEHDPTVPTWAKQPNKPTYTAHEVGAVASVNGATPDDNGNVTLIDVPSASVASQSDIDALWQ